MKDKTEAFNSSFAGLAVRFRGIKKEIEDKMKQHMEHGKRRRMTK